VATAIEKTVAELDLGVNRSKHLQAALGQHMNVPEGLRVGTATELRGALGAWTAELDQPLYGEPGYLSMIEVRASALADVLTAQIEAGIRANAQAGGALGVVAEWLWRDDTTDRLKRIETKVRDQDAERLAERRRQADGLLSIGSYAALPRLSQLLDDVLGATPTRYSKTGKAPYVHRGDASKAIDHDKAIRALLARQGPAVSVCGGVGPDESR